MESNYAKLCCSAVIVTMSFSCATPGGPPLPRVADEINETLLPVRRGLAPGDELEVAFAPGELTEWTHTITVAPDGYANFLSIEEMDVFGLTLKELRAKLTAAYSEVTDRPRLSVNVVKWAPRTLSVLGEVADAGSFVVDPNVHMNFTEALALAGGPRWRTAYLANTILVRWDPEAKRQRAWTFDARERHWGDPEALLLQPFDMIFIPNTPIDKVSNWIDAHLRVLIPIPRIFVPGV